MVRTSLRVVFAGLSLVLLACGGDDGTSVQGGTVRGSVLEGQEGISNVAITLTRSGSANRTASTDASGEFTLTSVDAGTWSASAAAPSGYTADGALIAAVDVTSGQTVTIPPFRMKAVPPPALATVNIIDFGFSPATVTVARNGTVRWTNSGNFLHDSSAQTWNSGDLEPGQTYEATFQTAGTFSYQCLRHPGMVGTVIVK